jgi:hypothetical protein
MLAASPATSQGSETGLVSFVLGPYEATVSSVIQTQNFFAAGPNNVDFSVGYKFTAADPIKVTHLGTLDWSQLAVAASGDGLDVALYQLSIVGPVTSGVLKASATVTTSDTLFSSAGLDGRDLSITNHVFRYHELTGTVDLSPGQYVIISEVVRSDLIPKSFGSFGFTGNLIPTPGLGLTYNQNWYKSGVSSAAFFADRISDDPTGGSYFGPNFLAIPEPTTLALAAATAVLLWRRRWGNW